MPVTNLHPPPPTPPKKQKQKQLYEVIKSRIEFSSLSGSGGYFHSFLPTSQDHLIVNHTHQLVHTKVKLSNYLTCSLRGDTAAELTGRSVRYVFSTSILSAS